MKYLRKRYKLLLMGLLPCAAYNLYFIFLLPQVELSYLSYLDFLVVLGMALWFFRDYRREKRRRGQKEILLEQKHLICEEFRKMEGMDSAAHMENMDIAEHDIAILNGQLQEQYRMNCELQDYMAKWCHEVKIPLTASLLMIEKMEDDGVDEEQGACKRAMREQLERISLQINGMLLGAKLQSSLFDLQIKKTSLLQCMKTSVHNNQFFLVKERFKISIPANDVMVYTDPAWTTYVLDQLISNAIKYAQENPSLKLYYRECEKGVSLCVEDNGEGIKESDIRRIFEKGYTGSNHHNGRYKSTGMGLYMVDLIMKRLGHQITVESSYGQGSRFCLMYYENVIYPRAL